MSVSAVVQFTQGVNVGPAGQALFVTTGAAVVVANGNNTNVNQWTFTVIDVPPGSAVPTGIVQSGALSTWTFTPDKTGGYLIQVTVTNTIDGSTATDTRCAGVKEANGRFVPPFKAIDTMLNFGAQTRGWAPYMEQWLGWVDNLPSFGVPDVGKVLQIVAGPATAWMATTGLVVALAGDVNGSSNANHVDTLSGPSGAVQFQADAFSGIPTIGAIFPGGVAKTATSYYLYASHNGLNVGMNAGSGGVIALNINGLNVLETQSTGLTLLDPSTVVRGTWETTHGRLTAGGGGSDTKTVIGPYVGGETSFAALYLLAGATAPSTTNHALVSDGVRLDVNAPTGPINFVFAEAGGISLSSAGTLNWTAATTPTLSQSARASDLATNNFTIISQAPFSGAVTNLVAGDVIVSIPASIGAGVKEGGFAVAFAANQVFRAGTWGGSTGTGAAWFGAAAQSPVPGNYTFLGDGLTYSILNAPSGGTLYFRINNADVFNATATAITIDGVAVLQWATGFAPVIQQQAPGTTSAGANMTIRPQAGGSVSGNVGSLIVDLPAPNGGSSEGALTVTRAATTNVMSVQQYPGLAGTVALALNNVAITNYTLYSDSVHNTHLSSPAGVIYFENAGSQLSYQSPTASAWHITSLQKIEWDAAQTSPTIYQVAAASDVAPFNFKISAQAPFATATVNKNPGTLLLEVPKSLSANLFYGGVLIQQADPTTPTPMIRLGMYGGPDVTYATIHFKDGGAPSSGNFGFLGNQTVTYLNVASGGSVSITVAGSAGYGFTLSGTNPQIVAIGTAVTSSQWGTNVANAVWNLCGGGLVNVLALSAPGSTAGTGNLSIIGSMQWTVRTSSASFTIDTTTNDNIVKLTATQTVTMPPHTAGRRIEFIIDTATGAAAATITWARNGGTGNINAVATSYIVTFQAGGVFRVVFSSDGTNWWAA